MLPSMLRKGSMASPKWQDNDFPMATMISTPTAFGGGQHMQAPAGPSSWHDSRSPLMRLAERGDTAAMSQLLAQGEVAVAAMDAQGQTALHYAAAAGHREAVEILLMHYSPQENINTSSTDGKTVLTAAVQSRYVDVVSALLEHASVQAHPDREALLAAVTSGQPNMIRALIGTFGTGLLFREDVVGEAMVAAAQLNTVDTLRYLLHLGASPNAVNGQDGRTALHAAVMADRSSNVAVLLERHDVDVNARTWSGCTPLWCAADMGYDQVLQMLLQSGRADLNAIAILLTPAEAAFRHGHEECCDMLLTAAERARPPSSPSSSSSSSSMSAFEYTYT